MDSSYVPLRLRSNYSLLTGASSIPSLLDRMVELGIKAAALTDVNNLYGAVPFVTEARSRGVKPILGTSIEHPTGSATLLARNLQGYRNLCKIVSRRQLDPGFSFLTAVSEFQEGLHIVVRDPGLAASLAARVGRRFLWLGLDEPADLARARATARRFDLQPVAATEITFAHPRNHGLHRVLAAVRLRTTVPRLRSGDVARADAYVHAPAEMAARWRDMPRVLRNTVEIAESCEAEMPGGRWVFPRSGAGNGAAAGKLRRLCLEGVTRRCRSRDSRVEARLEHELGVIDRLGFTDYFLIVGDIVRFARRQGIPTVGRGSGAGSLVAYALGITNVDPVRYGLCFERFLHDEREDCPDLDIDFCWRGRDEVIDYVYRTYGDERVAMISTHNLFHARSAFREVGTALGLSADEVGVLSRRLRRRGWRLDPGGNGMGDTPVEPELLVTILRVARELEGFPRHLGIHSGGIVIADTRIDDYLPLERATKGLVVTQPDMRGVEALGLVKMDLLGNRALSTIRETADLVRDHTGTQLEIDEIPDGDEATGDLLSRGATLGCFQVESPGMRQLLAKLRVRSLDGTIAALSLIRPGPAGSGMKEAYIRRAAGAEPITSPDPRVTKLLAETQGVMLYQEDVMRVASEVTGVSLAEADLLRRAIEGARDRDELAHLGKGFVRAAIVNDFAPAVADEIWERLAQFSAYAFCKAHASGYGALAYQSAYLKTHYPVEFAAAIMNNHQGMYPRWIHLEEARRRGVRILGPCVNTSSEKFTVQDSCLRIGLGQLRGLAKETRGAIVRARERDGPFLSLGDFQGRIDISLPEAEALALAGAFDFTGRPRPELLWELHASRTARQGPPRHGGMGRFLDASLRGRLGLREFPAHRKAWHEWNALHLSPSQHPLRWLGPSIVGDGWVGAPRPALVPGRRVHAVGVLAATRAVETRAGQRMGFVTLDDESGPFECVLFPDVYRRDRFQLDGLGPYEATGRVDEDFGVATLTVEKLTRLQMRTE